MNNLNATGSVYSITTIPTMNTTPLSIVDLPTEILESVFSYIPYETVSKLRLVCKRFDGIASSLLSSAFQRLQTLMLQRFQRIKAQMPRRESARRKHPLARESDIVETLHMRLTLLQMSFGKHIERKHCCFFAGEILDEVQRILHYVNATPSLARAYKVTDELFDLSTMAMEYFKEHIEPTLPEITYFGTDFLEFNSFSGSSSSKSCSWKMLDSPSTSNDKRQCSSNSGNVAKDRASSSTNTTTLKKKLNRFHQVMKRYDKKQLVMARDMKRCRSRMDDQEKKVQELTNRVEDFNKKAEENSCKFNAVLQELNKCKTELQYWRSKSPANQICCFCSKTISPNEDGRADGPANILDDGPPPLSNATNCHLVVPIHQADACCSNFIPIPEGENKRKWPLDDEDNELSAANKRSKEMDFATDGDTEVAQISASFSGSEVGQ